MNRFKEWLAEWKPHLVADGDSYGVRKRTFFGWRYVFEYPFSKTIDWVEFNPWVLTKREVAIKYLTAATQKTRLKRVTLDHPL